jgi:hypothetical protein
VTASPGGQEILDARDREQLHARGIEVAEAERQLALLGEAAAAGGRTPPFRLLRPCTPGDGIRRLDANQQEALRAAWQRAAASGGAAKMVPASGAATRMFGSLLGLLDLDPFPSGGEMQRRAAQGDVAARDLDRLWRELPRFPFFDELAVVCVARGTPLSELRESRDGRRLLRLLLTDRGLAMAELPKGLLLFHRYPSGSRTAVEEHLFEGARYLADAEQRCRFHFTVGADAVARFGREASEAADRLRRVHGTRSEVTFSTQHASTDTLAATPEGEPFRDEAGALLLRPGGHGALLENLQALDARWVLIKNVDNVRPETAQALVAHWQEVIGGLLVTLEERAHALLRRLRAAEGEATQADALADATRFLADELQAPAAAARGERPPHEQRRLVEDRLARPLRVVGVVENRGEPGGGPFWVVRPGGEVSPQIVEKAEVPESDEAQQRTFGASTHFNPVQLAVAFHDADGQRMDLARFVDPRAVFIARKSHGGRPLLALERPGLWNGAMAGWNTVFVEVPAETFAPMKTVFDLLRPEHQP